MDTGVEGHKPSDPEAQKPEGQEPEGHDPRPVFEGDWGKADGKARQAHLVRVNAWKQRNGLWGKGASSKPSGGKGYDPSVAAVLGSGAGSAPLTHDTTLGLETLRTVAADPAAPASARVTAASALRAAEHEAARTAAEEERARVTAALAAAPLPDRLMLLERIVRRDEPEGWVSVFAGTTQGQTPAEAARAAAEE